VTPEEIKQLRHRANYWAVENNRVVGWVVFYQNVICGWSHGLAGLETGGWLAGAVAIPVCPGCKPWQAVGGDLIDGAARWEEIQ
jgi:hypothetical protein